MNELLNDSELNVTGGWTPDVPDLSHTLYYLTDEQIEELLKNGGLGGTIYVRVVRISDGWCSPWMTLEQMKAAKYPIGEYRVEYLEAP